MTLCTLKGPSAQSIPPKGERIFIFSFRPFDGERIIFKKIGFQHVHALIPDKMVAVQLPSLLMFGVLGSFERKIESSVVHIFENRYFGDT